MNKFETLEQAMCKELEAIEQKVKTKNDMDVQDLDKIDKLAHAMKSLATYRAMVEAEEYGYSDNNVSGRRGRNPVNGRYVSMDNGGYSSQQSFEDGYSRGYAEGRSQAMSMRQPYIHPLTY